jgi:hypothetical protein
VEKYGNQLFIGQPWLVTRHVRLRIPNAFSSYPNFSTPPLLLGSETDTALASPASPKSHVLQRTFIIWSITSYSPNQCEGHQGPFFTAPLSFPRDGVPLLALWCSHAPCRRQEQRNLRPGKSMQLSRRFPQLCIYELQQRHHAGYQNAAIQLRPNHNGHRTYRLLL